MLYYGSKLSDNMKRREPEGYLYCLNVPIARTGEQSYTHEELGIPGTGMVKVVRLPEEVFSKEAMASFEGMPICNEHPYDDVTSENVSAYAKGHVQNVRRGDPPEDDLLMGDLIITHNDLIDEVLSGKREISCGYNCSYERENDGKIYQRAIRGNHVAVVENGRAGSRVAIRDAVPEINERSFRTMKNTPSFWARAVAKFVRDSEPDEGAQVIDEMMEGQEKPDLPFAPAPKQDNAPVPPMGEKPPLPPAPAPAPAPEMQKDEPVGDPMMAKILDLLTEIKAGMAANKATPADAEEEVTVPPEAIHDEEEEIEEKEIAPDLFEEEKAEDAGCEEENKVQDSAAAVRAAMKELRPVVAALPEEHRKKVSDAMTVALRKAAGMPASSSNGAGKLAKIAAGRRTADSAAEEDDGALGRAMMQKYNPHYKV